MNSIVMGIIRHLLTATGGGLVMHGVVSASDLDTAIGAVITLVGVVLSALKNQAAKPAK